MGSSVAATEILLFFFSQELKAVFEAAYDRYQRVHM
jgi:hypothetical protein